jgi:hypothetical protein
MSARKLVVKLKKARSARRFGVFLVRNSTGDIKGRQRSVYYSGTFTSRAAAQRALNAPMRTPWIMAKFVIRPLIAGEK